MRLTRSSTRRAPWARSAHGPLGAVGRRDGDLRPGHGNGDVRGGSGGGGGGTVSQTRSYVYDQYHRLCKTINPESGATVIDYDAAGNIAWTADGLNLPSTSSCDRTHSSIAAVKVTRTYDDMNARDRRSTPGGTADTTTTYFADGAVDTLTAANPGGVNVTTSYTYNRRRLLVSETSSNSLTPYSIGYSYDPNGNLSSHAYPGLVTVGYSPDALRRPTQVAEQAGQVYASGITYWPNGAIKGFTYGNGIVHTMTQNKRMLPEQSKDARTGTVFLDDTYTYDANGNVESITDALPAGPNDRSRDLGYDGLDRMIVADSASGDWVPTRTTPSTTCASQTRACASTGTRTIRTTVWARSRTPPARVCLPSATTRAETQPPRTLARAAPPMPTPSAPASPARR